jgi:hypothetical protein
MQVTMMSSMINDESKSNVRVIRIKIRFKMLLNTLSLTLLLKLHFLRIKSIFCSFLMFMMRE